MPPATPDPEPTPDPKPTLSDRIREAIAKVETDLKLAFGSNAIDEVGKRVVAIVEADGKS
jgi:hypothetical protein